MQRTLIQFQTVRLTPEQIRRLYDYFQTEAQQYRQRYHQYLAPDAYAGVLEDIMKMLERMEL
jgi:20S proteasome alpha/beta subunit